MYISKDLGNQIQKILRFEYQILKSQHLEIHNLEDFEIQDLLIQDLAIQHFFNSKIWHFKI